MCLDEPKHMHTCVLISVSIFMYVYENHSFTESSNPVPTLPVPDNPSLSLSWLPSLTVRTLGSLCPGYLLIQSQCAHKAISVLLTHTPWETSLLSKGQYFVRCFLSLEDPVKIPFSKWLKWVLPHPLQEGFSFSCIRDLGSFDTVCIAFGISPTHILVCWLISGYVTVVPKMGALQKQYPWENVAPIPASPLLCPLLPSQSHPHPAGNRPLSSVSGFSSRISFAQMSRRLCVSFYPHLSYMEVTCYRHLCTLAWHVTLGPASLCVWVHRPSSHCHSCRVLQVPHRAV